MSKIADAYAEYWAEIEGPEISAAPTATEAQNAYYRILLRGGRDDYATGQARSFIVRMLRRAAFLIDRGFHAS